MVINIHCFCPFCIVALLAEKSNVCKLMNNRSLLVSVLIMSLLYALGPMTSFARNNYWLDINSTLDDDFDEIQIWILSGGGTNSVSPGGNNTVFTLRSVLPEIQSQPILSLYQSSTSLKVKTTLDEVVVIKITKIGDSSIGYEKELNSSISKEITFGTTGWGTGFYNIEFVNSTGTILAKGTINIH